MPDTWEMAWEHISPSTSLFLYRLYELIFIFIGWYLTSVLAFLSAYMHCHNHTTVDLLLDTF